MQTKILISISLFIIMFSQAYSQTEVTLDEAIEIALKKNYNLKMVRYNKQQADSKVDEAFGHALPSINVSGNFTRALDKQNMFFGEMDPTGPFGLPFLLAEFHKDEPIIQELLKNSAESSSEPIEIGSDNAFSTRIEVTQTLFDYSVFTGIGSSKRYSEAASEALSDEEMNTVMMVKKSYYGVLLAKESVDLIKSSIETATKNLNDIKIMFKEGLISEYDLIRTEVQVDNLQPDLLNAETMYKTSLNNFNLVLGLQESEKVSTKETFSDLKISLDVPEIDGTKQKVVSNNNQLKSLDLQMQVQEDFIVLYQSEFVPRFSLFGNYSYMGNANDGNEFTNFSSSEVGLRMSINLFNGMQSSNRVEQAEIDFMKVETQKTMLESSLINQTDDILGRMNTAKRKIESAEKTVNQAKRGYEIAKMRYDEGIGALLEINDADIALRQAKLNKIRADYDFLSAQAELEKISGK